MNRNALTPFSTRLANFFRRLVHWFRRFRLKKIMGWILILKTFNTVLLVLMLALFAFLTIRNIEREFRVADNKIQVRWNNFVNSGFDILEGEFWETVGKLIESPFLYFTAIWNILVALLYRILLFLALAIVWILLTFIATAYSEWSHGLAGSLIRGESRLLAPGASSGAQTQPVAKLAPPLLDTPPVLIIDRACISLPVLLKDKKLPQTDMRERSFGHADQLLLIAQAVWHDRFVSNYYHQLADQEDADVWDSFWQGLIKLGFNPHEVKRVISNETTTLEPSVHQYLPHAELHPLGEKTKVTIGQSVIFGVSM